jgi:hypothetical protein
LGSKGIDKLCEGAYNLRKRGRIISIVVAVLSPFWIPAGTILRLPVLMYLAKPEAREYYKGIHYYHISLDRYDSCG